MSLDGQSPPRRADRPAAIVVSTFAMAHDDVFASHTHSSHQLAWSPSGVLTVREPSHTWVLPPTRALWIPAGVAHETAAWGQATMQTLYIEPDGFSVAWREPRPVGVTPLLGDLIGYLADLSLDPGRRARAESLLPDLLTPVDTVAVDVRMPTDERALDVAHALGAQPGDPRTLEHWGREVGASARTLARAFLTETGLTFGRWRTTLRLSAAIPRLAAGEPVSRVAEAVGYGTPSAFIAAFRDHTGVTPGAYFRST